MNFTSSDSAPDTSLRSTSGSSASASSWRRQAAAGVTLVEVMVALLVFVVGLLGIIGLQGVTIVANDRARGGGTAKNLAIARLDQLRRGIAASPELALCPTAWNPNNPTWCHVDAGPAGTLPVHQANPGGNPNGNAAVLDELGIVNTGGQARYRRYWHVQADTSGFPNAVEVRMRVDWQDSQVKPSTGGVRQLTYETVLVF